MIHAVVGVMVMAVLFAVFVGFHLADGRGCHGCSGGGSDCSSCHLGGDDNEFKGRAR